MAEKKAASSKSGGRSGGSGGAKGENRPEHYAETEVLTCFISGNTFRAKAVQYVVVDGMAMFEGDIVLGTAEQVARDSEVLASELRGELASGVIVTGAQFRWTGCQVPFDVDPALPNQQRVTDAIAHWQTHTGFTFVARTAANAASFPDWVTFRPSSGCSSSVGKRGGQQFVNLAPGCTTGNAIHEIGHTVGMWHEQSRQDRDAFVTIHWANIQTGLEHNFDQHISDGDDIGAYDYGSIMHYPRDAFGINGAETITPTNPATAAIGQRTALSPGDIVTANTLCPGSHHETLKEQVKERFPETIKERIPETLKEQVKERFPETIKERIPETVKEQIETIVEGGPNTLVEGLGQPGGQLGGRVGGPLVNPAIAEGQLPFAMRTPTVGLPGDLGAAAGAMTGEMVGTGDPLEDRLSGLEQAVEMIAAGQAELLAHLTALAGGGAGQGGQGGQGGHEHGHGHGGYGHGHGGGCAGCM
ncbi:hypothetical protein BH10ACT10_BH10ACT10_12980 [soil metagenome]